MAQNVEHITRLRWALKALLVHDLVDEIFTSIVNVDHVAEIRVQLQVLVLHHLVVCVMLRVVRDTLHVLLTSHVRARRLRVLIFIVILNFSLQLIIAGHACQATLRCRALHLPTSVTASALLTIANRLRGF